jgi:outer membrane protein assembly factor BamB
VPSTGVGGLMVAGDVVIVSARDASDARDCFLALDLVTGVQRWRQEYEAVANLDYGNSPRATPAFSDRVVVTLGATGVVSALDPATGATLWRIDLTRRFEVPPPTWGFCGSPLILDGSVVLQVADEPSIVSLDLVTGDVRWKASGQPAAYSSLMPLGGNRQVVGVTQQGYFVRRARDGGLVWFANPEFSGDFGVPSAVLAPEGLIFTSENNGIQLFAGKDRYPVRPSAVNDILIPDSHTPVLVGDQLLVAHEGLHALDAGDSLSKRWSIADELITGYASLIASDRRALVTTERGDLLLVSIAEPGGPKKLDQRRLETGRVSLLSHPAIQADRLLIRVGTEVRCYRLPQ